MLNFINPVYSKADNEILKEFGEMLKQRRINNNFTQQEFADAIGISVNHLSRIERTGKTTLATLTAISRKFGLLQQLLDVYKNPELTPMQRYEIEQKTAKIKTGRKRVKKKNIEFYEKNFAKNIVYDAITESVEQVKNGAKPSNAKDVFAKLESKYVKKESF